MHQLGEDGRFLTESLEDNVQHGCEEDVEQQRGQTGSGAYSRGSSRFDTYIGLACDHGNSFLCLEEQEREGYWIEVRTVFNVKTTTTWYMYIVYCALCYCSISFYFVVFKENLFYLVHVFL